MFDKKAYYKKYNKSEKVKKQRSLAQQKYYIKNKEKLKEWQKKYYQKPQRKYYSYKIDANKRGLQFKLSFEEFMIFWQKPCYYCNNNIETVGIDRINNKIGYISKNIVSCCVVCNYMKRQLTVKQFLKHCIKIIDNLKNK